MGKFRRLFSAARFGFAVAAIFSLLPIADGFAVAHLPKFHGDDSTYCVVSSVAAIGRFRLRAWQEKFLRYLVSDRIDERWSVRDDPRARVLASATPRLSTSAMRL